MRLSRSFIAVGVVGFLATSLAVAGGGTRAADQLVLETAQSVDSDVLDLLGSLVGTLGRAETATIVAVSLALAWWRHRGPAGLVPLLLFAGVAIEVAMKYLLPHPAPPSGLDRSLDFLPFLSLPSPFSYPSGHVLRTTFLATLLGPRVRSPWRWVLAGVVVAMVLSRVYLGEHWLSDTIGGLLLGLALGGIALWIERR